MSDLCTRASCAALRSDRAPIRAAPAYNSAAVVAPRRGLLGHYRKTRPFPLTEAVPAWLDGPWLRRALPWTGHWRAGDGARVFPLLLADGREVPVQPLICLDALDTRLSLEAVRQGAQALLTLSNDSWFDADGPGPDRQVPAGEDLAEPELILGDAVAGRGGAGDGGGGLMAWLRPAAAATTPG